MSNLKRSQPFLRRSPTNWERCHAAVPTVPPLLRGGNAGTLAGNDKAATVENGRAHRAPDPALIADELASRVSRLTVSHRDPHRFHEEKSEIANALRELADELYRGKA